MKTLNLLVIVLLFFNLSSCKEAPKNDGKEAAFKAKMSSRYIYKDCKGILHLTQDCFQIGFEIKEGQVAAYNKGITRTYKSSLTNLDSLKFCVECVDDRSYDSLKTQIAPNYRSGVGRAGKKIPGF